jgi:large subunit ribosomal protein L22
LVRGQEAFKALGILKFTKKEAARRVENLLKSAIANWEQKTDSKAEAGQLYISTIYVNEAPMLKRLRPAPQGRGHRIRKRSNHVTLFLDNLNKEA